MHAWRCSTKAGSLERNEDLALNAYLLFRDQVMKTQTWKRQAVAHRFESAWPPQRRLPRVAAAPAKALLDVVWLKGPLPYEGLNNQNRVVWASKTISHDMQ